MAFTLPLYETDQLISIIGSKRPFLTSLRLMLSHVTESIKKPTFLDPFCGSGSVSRLARSMGMRVSSSDLLPFSEIINSVYLGLTQDDLVPLFADFGGLDAYLTMLNLEGLYAASDPDVLKSPYLSYHYAPQDEKLYDPEKERLFFTPQNGRFFDTVRNEIEESFLEGRISEVEKRVVLASILYEASRKANTSGSFTSYLKSFSHRGRTTELPQLRAPFLPPATYPKGEMALEEASSFLKKRSGDICFLDPPFSAVQYSSAYHLLNTITLWDGWQPASVEKERGGIRDDWKESKSRFSSLYHGDAAFVQLFNSIDARHIVLSYPTNAIVSSERIVELLSARHDKITIVPLFKRNQGGRQLKGRERSVEQLFITGNIGTSHYAIEDSFERLSLFKELEALSMHIFTITEEMSPLHFVSDALLVTPLPTTSLLELPFGEFESLLEKMRRAQCQSEEDSLMRFCSLIASSTVEGESRVIIERRFLSYVKLLLSNDKEKTKERLRKLANHFKEGERCVALLSRFIYDAKEEQDG